MSTHRSKTHDVTLTFAIYCGSTASMFAVCWGGRAVAAAAAAAAATAGAGAGAGVVVGLVGRESPPPRQFPIVYPLPLRVPRAAAAIQHSQARRDVLEGADPRPL